MIINSKDEILKLKEISSELENIDEIKTYAETLKTYLTENHGRAVGISCPQIGINKNMFAINLKSGEILICVNPFFSEKKNLVFSYEGCMSLNFDGNIECYIPRFNTISTTYHTFNHKGELKKYNKNLSGRDAFAFQHELDHLNGILIIDKAWLYPVENIKKGLKYRSVKRLILKNDLVKKGEDNEVLPDQIVVDYIIEGDETTLYSKRPITDFEEEHQIIGISIKDEDISEFEKNEEYIENTEGQTE